MALHARLTLCPNGLELLQATPVVRTQDEGDNKLMLFGSIAAAVMGNLEVVEAGACATGVTLILSVRIGALGLYVPDHRYYSYG